MVVSDTDPVPPLFLGKVRSAVPEVVAIIGSGSFPSPLVDDPGEVAVDGGPPVSQAVAPVRMDAAPLVSPVPPPPDAGGGVVVPKKRRRW